CYFLVHAPKGHSNKVASLSGGHDQWLPACEQETSDKFTCLKAFSSATKPGEGQPMYRKPPA
ncbi:MAG: hypothetical protein ACRC1I_27470, partial [Pseudomonas proteolytica]|uniref:hypothetical protein n=1 Tax=Pseudomonas proteolytica TaxID=219574 RepID=UPI003F4037B4